MKRLSSLSFVVISLFGSHAFSVLTDGNVKNSTDLDFSSLDAKHVDVFRQLLNQETLIRMTLVKNVNELMKDMVSLQQDVVSAESEISLLKDKTDREISELKKEVRSLKLENNRISNEVTRCNKNINFLNENITELDVSRRVFETQLLKEKQMFEQNTSGILADIKIEVRYLSTTLLDLNKHTLEIDKNIPEIIDNRYVLISQRLNNSLDKLSLALSDLQKTQRTMAVSLSDDMNKTTEGLKSEVKQTQFEQLKLSSAVSSLEVFRLNFTNKQCGVSTKVAFTAGITSADSSWSGSTLIFPKIVYNAGGGYDPGTGIFTTPVDGQYVFFVSVQSYNQNEIYVDIVLNGESKVRTMAYDQSDKDYYETGVNLVVLNLNQGDKVWVKRYYGSGYYTKNVPITTFSGFLL